MGATGQVEGWWRYVVSCFSSDYNSPVCQDYWNWVANGAFALAGLIIVLVGWSMLRQYSAFWRGLRHLKGGAQTGDPLDLDSKEMTEKFQAALEKRKAELRESQSDQPGK